MKLQLLIASSLVLIPTASSIHLSGFSLLLQFGPAYRKEAINWTLSRARFTKKSYFRTIVVKGGPRLAGFKWYTISVVNVLVKELHNELSVINKLPLELNCGPFPGN